MSLIVQKFGGSSVRDYAHLLRMARIVKSRVDEGDDVVVVLSAQGDTTDGLLQKAKEISEQPSPRELDMLLSAGEQMSAALGAMTLRSIGVEAVSLCAWQIPIETDGTHGNAEIELIDTVRIRKELAEGHVVVAAGFQGVDENVIPCHTWITWSRSIGMFSPFRRPQRTPLMIFLWPIVCWRSRESLFMSGRSLLLTEPRWNSNGMPFLMMRRTMFINVPMGKNFA